MKVLSFGAGVNTFALLALAKKGELDFDYVVFADTGCEYPETNRAIEEIAKPIAEEMGIPFIHLHPVVEGSPTLYAHCIKKRIIPFRVNRWCTDKFKIRPIKEWVVSQGLKGCEILLGFDAGEPERAKDVKKISLYTKRFPLIELGIDRKGCDTIIKTMGWPSIQKSGCYFCPQSRLGQLRWFCDTYPDLYAKAEFLEKQGKDYPKSTIFEGKTLEEIRLRRNDKSTQTALLGFEDKGCRDGGCFR